MVLDTFKCENILSENFQICHVSAEKHSVLCYGPKKRGPGVRLQLAEQLSGVSTMNNYKAIDPLQ